MSRRHTEERRSGVSPARVVIVDDHALVRRTIRRFLSSHAGMEVCAEAADPAEALRVIRREHPDLVLLDLELGPESGFRVLEELGTQVPPVPVLVLSLHSESLYAARCLAAGAKGYIMKNDAPDHLVGAIRWVLDGKTYLSPAQREAVTRQGAAS